MWSILETISGGSEGWFWDPIGRVSGGEIEEKRVVREARRQRDEKTSQESVKNSEKDHEGHLQLSRYMAARVSRGGPGPTRRIKDPQKTTGLEKQTRNSGSDTLIYYILYII